MNGSEKLFLTVITWCMSVRHDQDAIKLSVSSQERMSPVSVMALHRRTQSHDQHALPLDFISILQTQRATLFV